MKEFGLIYKVTNVTNNKVYIGQTIQSVKERKRQHYKFAELKQNYKFSNALNKYSMAEFTWEILEDNIVLENLNIKEVYYINLYNSFNNGYNSTPGGNNRFKRKATTITMNNTKKLYNLKTNEVVTLDAYTFIEQYYTNYKSKGAIYGLFNGKYIRFLNWILYENIEKHKLMLEKNKNITSNCKKDFTVYNFINMEDKINFMGTRIDFINKFNLSKGMVSQLISNQRSKYKNWTIKNKEDELSSGN